MPALLFLIFLIAGIGLFVGLINPRLTKFLSTRKQVAWVFGLLALFSFSGFVSTSAENTPTADVVATSTLTPTYTVTVSPTVQPVETSTPTPSPTGTTKGAATTKATLAPTKVPSPTAKPTQSSVVSSGDKDCGDFKSQNEAQSYFNSKGGNASNNVDDLDRDNDGIACETYKY